MANKQILKRVAREKRAKRVRKELEGTGQRPRLVVHKSLKQIYAQLVNDLEHKTMATVSSLKLDGSLGKTKIERAKAVGQAIAKKALELGIKKVIFDRSSYRYHGKVKALAEGARESGLEF